MIEDASQVMEDMLQDNWNNVNTDDVTPTISVIYTLNKRIDLAEASIIAVYESNTVQQANSIGKVSRRTQTRVSIDIRTMKSRSHGLKLLKEVDRIINNQIVLPTGGYDILNPDFQWIDLSDKTKNLWRWVYDVELIKTNETRPL